MADPYEETSGYGADDAYGGYYTMFGVDYPIYEEGPSPDIAPRIPPTGMLDPSAPIIVPDPSYPSGFGLLSPEVGPIPIDWSSVLDLSSGGGGSVGDIAVGAGGELLYGYPGFWSGMGSIYDTPLWTEGAFTPPSEADTSSMLSGAGWSIPMSLTDTSSLDVLGSIATGSPVEPAPTETPSFAGGGGLLCDPITGKCPTYR